MIQSRRNRWLSGIGGVLMASAALLWFIDPAGAIPLESWDDKIPIAAQRFKVLSEFGDAAVLDRETGLVWERSPVVIDGPNLNGAHEWAFARGRCTSRTTGGRKGWRLPSVHELASLLDANATTITKLPLGHPFTNVLEAGYWSATTVASNTLTAWVVIFNPFMGVDDDFKTDLYQVWCVRGGQNHGSEY